MEQTKEFIEQIENRASIYSFFSRAYREEADEDFLYNLEEGCEIAIINDPELKGPLTELRTFLDGPEKEEDMITGLAEDFAALFLG